MLTMASAATSDTAAVPSLDGDSDSPLPAAASAATDTTAAGGEGEELLVEYTRGAPGVNRCVWCGKLSFVRPMRHASRSCARAASSCESFGCVDTEFEDENEEGDRRVGGFRELKIVISRKI